MASTFPATADLPQNGSVNARYLMDEASGNAIDLIGALDLTDNGSVGAGTGFSDAGASFDNSRDFIPSNDYFSHADNAAFDLTGAFTLSALFRPNNLSANAGVFSKWTGAQRSYQIFQPNK